MEKGLVIKSTGSWYKVQKPNKEIIDCKIRGKIRLKGIRTTNPISVGDIVQFLMLEDGTGLITKIETRKNYIIRKATNLSKESHIIAANIDQAFIVLSLKHPTTPLEFVDRFLVTAEAYSIKAYIIFNKTDILSDEEKEDLQILRFIYKEAGYESYEISAKQGTNIDQIRNMLPGKISLFAGNSGVGKSTLLNSIQPGLELKTGDISDAHKTGKHTTTFSEMFELEKDTYIIDTPGIRGFGIIDLDKQELWHYFPEIFKESHKCQFNNCTHTHEPKCAVKQAVEEVRISETRYLSYLSILEDENEKHRLKF